MIPHRPIVAAEILSRLSSFSFLFRGVQRGYFSFQRSCSEIVKADELLISARGLRCRSRFPLADSRSMSDSAICTNPLAREGSFCGVWVKCWAPKEVSMKIHH